MKMPAMQNRIAPQANGGSEPETIRMPRYVEPHRTYTIPNAVQTATLDGAADGLTTGRVGDICTDVFGVVPGNGGVAGALGCEGMTRSRYGERGAVVGPGQPLGRTEAVTGPYRG